MIKGLLRQLLAFILSFFEIIAPWTVGEVEEWIEGEKEPWTAEMPFDESSFVKIEKTAGEDFRILNLTDIQLYNRDLYTSELYQEDSELTLTFLGKIIEDQQPDLITISGDSFCGFLTSLEIIDIIDSYDIPWAAVYGNHDAVDGKQSEWLAYQLEHAENSLFEAGPEEMGYGNYILNLTEDGKVIHTLYMMDTHNQTVTFEQNGKTYECADFLWENQMEWYEWGVHGNTQLAGYLVPSTIIMHKPMKEYRTAWYKVATKRTEEAPFGTVKPECADIAFGYCGEDGGWTSPNNYFERIKALGSTKDIIVAHKHLNSYSVLYEGVRLTYAVKSGYGGRGYYDKNLIGGTILTINSEGETTISQAYYTEENGVWAQERVETE